MSSNPSARRRAPGADDVDLGVVDGLVQLSFLVQSVLSSVACGADLTLLQARLLGVSRDRRPTMAELGRLLNLDKSSMTGLVDRAERRGIVRRTHDPKDGRSYRIVLSEEGRRVAATLEGEVSKQIAALTAGLSDGEQEQLSLFASRIIIRSAADNGIDLTVSSS